MDTTRDETAKLRRQLEAELRRELEAELRRELEAELRDQLEAKLRCQLEREAQMNIIRAKAGELGRSLRRTVAARYVTDNYFPCSPKTLAKLACVSSQGPPFRLAGRIPMYPVSGLDEWAQSKIGPLVRSTSEVRHPQAKPAQHPAHRSQANVEGGRLADHGRERSIEQPERQLPPPTAVQR